LRFEIVSSIKCTYIFHYSSSYNCTFCNDFSSFNTLQSKQLHQT